MRTVVFRGGVILILALASFFISGISLIKNFERQTVDYRFQFRGMKSVHPDLILVLIEEKTQRTLGQFYDSFKNFAEIGLALNKLGAKVIGYDLQFTHQFSDTNSSLISNLFENSSQITLPCYFYPLYKDEVESESSDLDTSLQKFAWSIPQLDPKHLHQAANVINPTASLLRRLKSIGHINVCPDSLVRMGHLIPLFINYQNRIYPAFIMEILRQYYNLDFNQITVTGQNVLIQISESQKLKIPISTNGEVHINFPGDFSVFKDQCYSFVDILKLSEKIANTPSEMADFSIFKNKIVLVGTTTGADIFSIPFSDNLPGIFLHASLLSNILENNFITELNRTCTLLVIIFLSIIIGFFILRLKPVHRFFLLVGMAGLYWLFCFMLFIGFGYALNLLTPTFFIMLNIFFVFKNDFRFGYNLFKKFKLPILPKKAEAIQTQPQKDEPQFSFFRIVISLIKTRENHSIIHTIETERDRKHEFSAFHRSPQSQNPHNCPSEKMNKLAHDKEKLDQTYFIYLQEQCQQQLKPLELLKKIGTSIYYDFGLTSTFKELHELSKANTYLNFVVDDLTIPWHWAYHQDSNTFLCDLYPYSYSLAIDRVNLKNANFDSGEYRLLQPTHQKAALILYGTWSGEPGKQLKEAEGEINQIQLLLRQQNHVTTKVGKNVGTFLSDLITFVNDQNDLRIIHYTGHIEKNRLDIDHQQYLESGTIQEKGLHFHSRPIVFLNGCNSGNLGHLWDKYDDLATEFLACGAAACIVTTNEIVETTARRFSESFYRNFIQDGMTVGEALRHTRFELSNLKIRNKYDPECDITRYFYTILGDPTVKF